MGKVRFRHREPSMAAVEAEWRERALSAAVEGAKKAIDHHGSGVPVPAAKPVGRLSDAELGWLVSGGICSWISAMSRQACALGGFDYEKSERALRSATFDDKSPAPWDAGAVEAILPSLGSVSGVDWSKPVGEWPRESMVRFLCEAFARIEAALEARDKGGIIRPPAANDATGV